MSRKHRLILKTAAEWEAIVEQWRVSGLKARTWCRQNHVIYSTFIGWRKRLQKNCKPAESPSISPKSFVEIVETPSNNSGVIVECQGIQIYLARGFDSTVFQNCIKVLKEGLCCR